MQGVTKKLWRIAKIAIITIAAVIVLSIGAIYASIQLAEAKRLAWYRGDLSSKLVQLEFSGQRRHVFVTNPAFLMEFEKSLHQTVPDSLGGSTTYTVLATLANGEKIDCTCHVSPDASILSIQVPQVIWIDDPDYRSSPAPTSALWKSISEVLLSDTALGNHEFR